MDVLDFGEAARAARREYQREYRKKHPEKTREANRRYWAKRAARLAAERESVDGGDNIAETNS